MFTAFKHTHVLFVSLFILLYLVKTLMLLFSSREKLDRFNTRMRIPESIISTLFLATGLYLAFHSGLIRSGYWFWVKMAIVVLSIPVGFIAYRRHIKWLGVVILLSYVYVFGMAQTKSVRFNPVDVYRIREGQADIEAGANRAESLYETYCALCHGKAGDAGLNGAFNLQESVLSPDETEMVIREGRKSMKGFGRVLSEDEINRVRDYVIGLREGGE